MGVTQREGMCVVGHELGLVFQTVAIILGGFSALYALKKFGWLRGLYEDEDRSLRLIAAISVVVNVGVLLVRLVF